ncbi:hypothetical protein AVEN_192806-1 [Araneus ventricosus]|uniref:Uncharacterized protein n=1 Tax=Araneus ventricosus TaxID=182803 RepID=A0A4Y2SPH2_ARAVE|nr:hypothetical protein AVEN_192806-1 [Araneus ventricosus]
MVKLATPTTHHTDRYSPHQLRWVFFECVKRLECVMSCLLCVCLMENKILKDTQKSYFLQHITSVLVSPSTGGLSECAKRLAVKDVLFLICVFM